MIQFTAYSQQSIAERHAVETYFKNDECHELLLVKDSTIQLWQSKYTYQKAYSDTLVWSFYSLKTDATNLEKNCRKDMKQNKVLRKWVTGESAVIVLSILWLLR